MIVAGTEAETKILIDELKDNGMNIDTEAETATIGGIVIEVKVSEIHIGAAVILNAVVIMR